MSDALIERHRSEWPIVNQWAVRQVSRRGFYSWRQRPPSPTATKRRLSKVRQWRKSSS